MRKLMDIERIKVLSTTSRIRWSAHVAQRMMERSISRSDVISAILTGEIIEDYPEDFPLPSCLISGIVNRKPIHVVVAQDEEEIVIISVYRPDLNKFEPDFRTRRK